MKRKKYHTMKGNKLNVNNPSIKFVCDKKYGFKHAYTRDTKEKYKFKYITKHEYYRQMIDKYGGEEYFERLENQTFDDDFVIEKDNGEKIVIKLNTQDLY